MVMMGMMGIKARTSPRHKRSTFRGFVRDNSSVGRYQSSSLEMWTNTRPDNEEVLSAALAVQPHLRYRQGRTGGEMTPSIAP